MRFEIDKNLISWETSGKEISIRVSDIDQALYSKEQNAVIILAGHEQKFKKIYAFNTTGESLCEIEQPPETYFCGLGQTEVMM